MRRLLRATVMIGVLVLAGCDSDSDSDGASSSTTSTSADSGSSSSSSGPTTTLAPGGSSSAEEAVLAYIDAASKDQWGRVWDGIHPDQKALFTREAFIECGAAPPFTVDDVDVVETYEENISLPGVSDSVPSTRWWPGNPADPRAGHADDHGARLRGRRPVVVVGGQGQGGGLHLEPRESARHTRL